MQLKDQAAIVHGANRDWAAATERRAREPGARVAVCGHQRQACRDVAAKSAVSPCVATCGRGPSGSRRHCCLQARGHPGAQRRLVKRRLGVARG